MEPPSKCIELFINTIVDEPVRVEFHVLVFVSLCELDHSSVRFEWVLNFRPENLSFGLKIKFKLVEIIACLKDVFEALIEIWLDLSQLLEGVELVAYRVEQFLVNNLWKL